MALASAMCLALGTQVQSAAVTSHTQEALKPTSLLSLVRNRTWVGGLLLLGLGTALNVTALSLATVTVVQPIGVIALVITTLLHAKHKNLHINPPTWGAIACCTVGGAAFVVAAVMGTDATALADPRAETLIVRMLIGLGVVIGVLELFLNHRRISMFYVLSAGCLYGFVAVLVRLTVTHALAHGISQVNWFTVALIVAASVLGGWMVQVAYSCGPPDLVIAGLTVVDPIVGVALGLWILGEAGHDLTAALALVMAAAGAIAIVGVVLLSRHHPEVLARKAAARETHSAGHESTDSAHARPSRNATAHSREH